MAATPEQLANLRKARAAASAKAAERRREKAAAAKAAAQAEKAQVEAEMKLVRQKGAKLTKTRAEFLTDIVNRAEKRMVDASESQFVQLAKIQMDALNQLEALGAGADPDEKREKTQQTALSEFEKRMSERRNSAAAAGA